jgi:putative transposase
MKLRHYDNEGHARFVTFCTHRKIPVLTHDSICRIVYEAIMEARDRLKFDLLAYVIMPEHVHLVLVPAENTKLGLVIGEIKRLSSKRIHRVLGENRSGLLRRLMVMRDGGPRFALWQRRCYDHNCRSEKAVWEKVRYCHGNPVKRGLVRDASRWQWSSAAWYDDSVETGAGQELSDQRNDPTRWVGYQSSVLRRYKDCQRASKSDKH